MGHASKEQGELFCYGVHNWWYKFFMSKFTFIHLGAKNSFSVKPISAYDNGESQNPHFSQLGMDAVAI
jgi:hypothetical protein